MTRHILKSILVGLLIGAAFFIMPFFLLKFFIFFLIIGVICRLVWGGRRGGRWRHTNHFAFADKIRNMNEEEYNAFKTKMQNHHWGSHHYGCGNNYYNNCNETATKTDTKNETTNTQQP